MGADLRRLCSSLTVPQYFFNVRDGRSSIDEEGDELPDHASAKRMAVAVLAELLPDHADSILKGGQVSIQVLDDQRSPICAVTARLEDSG